MRHDTFLKCMLGACLAILVCALVVVGYATYQAISDRGEWECESTGRKALVMMPAGKVMVPIMQEETICKRVEK